MKFSTILADPPWNYDDSNSNGKRGAVHKYKCLSTDELAALNVAAICAEDCALFLWATFPMLPEAFHVLKSWGFRYRTTAFVWVKLSKSRTYFKGLGHWTRSNAEIVLLGTRGKPLRVDKGIGQIIQAHRLRHSAKPPIVREKIVNLMGDKPRIELFARDKAEGWDATGLELDGADIRDFLKAQMPSRRQAANDLASWAAEQEFLQGDRESIAAAIRLLKSDQAVPFGHFDTAIRESIPETIWEAISRT